MSFHWCDNIHTTVFTPRDHQVELLAAAYERNTMICLGHKSSKEFIALKLLQELGRDARTREKISIYFTCHVGGRSSMFTMIQHLTDLKVYQEDERTASADDAVLPPSYHVYIMHPRRILAALRAHTLRLDHVALLMLEDCHEAAVHEEVLPIFREFYRPARDTTMPKVIGLAGPLHSAGCALQELSAMLGTLEKNTHCRTETASDIVTVLRYCSKPIEYIVQCAPATQDELSVVLEEFICTRKAFLNDHRYDPTEIYNTDEFLEELKDIPDPKREPLELLDNMLAVLHEMGPWAADRVALNMFHRIEKQKIKTPHERHYILLCLVNTVLLEIHAVCECAFRRWPNHKERVERFSSPKILRLLEVLRLFKPDEFETNNATMRNLSSDIEQLDFTRLTRSLEYSCQSVESIAAKHQLQARSIVENLDAIVAPPETAATYAARKAQQKQQLASQMSASAHGQQQRRHSGAHGRGAKRRAFHSRRQLRRESGDAADTLCALIFCNETYTARVLFDLLAEMNRHDPQLKFLKCQYTTDRIADPVTEPKEAELEHRRQEDVLKRFRMHDCNVLIGTAVLEEGIDVPKCNLVVRWDAPTTYRSYVQCKGRARASHAFHIMLVAPPYDATAVESSSEQLSDRSHCFLCRKKDDADDISEESDDHSNDDDVEDEFGDEVAGKRSGKQQFTIGSAKGIVKILNPEVITNKPPIARDLTLEEINDEALPAIAPLDGATVQMPDASDKLLLIEIQPKLEALKLDPAPEAEPPKRSPRQRFQCGVQASWENEAEAEREVLESSYREDKIERVLRTTCAIVEQLAQYREIEKMLLLKCANAEPTESEHLLADAFTSCVAAYKPQPQLLTGAAVDLGSAIALVNKYCSKLPSDTFTKLTALWRCARTERAGVTLYQCTLRLPINSPLKYDIVGLPMPTHTLARRMAALQACRELHRCGELDDNLQPIGKEGFRALEPDWENFELEAQDERIVLDNAEPRPGTTKRRQYYYKRIASEFCDCRPTIDSSCYLYLLDLTLQCPIPEEQNTRGRKIYPPEDAQQGFGILTLKRIPKVSAFPIFTRSGEVRVAIELSPSLIVLSPEQIRCINTFVNYTFTNVLRLQKFLMLFDPDSTENCVFIVPTIRTASGKRLIDWQFLGQIERNAGMMPRVVPDHVRSTLEFDAQRFRDAVVMPWYRNQDQPQYFYVAEICPQLSPLSCFPGENYRTFRHYYALKYGLTIQNAKQPLLDVDHTSARLNFLTPRYVNRKGVALPTSSEETKRAKRENLEQKQILVPELCTVHPFPASLWRTAVCLPCILYRINGLLLADDIRKTVSADIGLGQQDVDATFEWPMLDFGWSLSEVLKKSKENQRIAQEQQEQATQAMTNGDTQEEHAGNEEKRGPDDRKNASGDDVGKSKTPAKSANEMVIEAEKKLKDSSFIDIGTWSNDMAENIKTSELTDDEEEEYMKYLPPNVSFCDQPTRYGSPTFWDLKDDKTKKPSTNGNSSFDSEFCANGAGRGEDRVGDGDGGGNSFRRNSYAYYDSDDSLSSSYEGTTAGVGNYAQSEDDDDDDGVAFTSRNEAETIETELEIEKRNKQLSIIQATNANELNYQQTKNLQVGYNFDHQRAEISHQLVASVARFDASTQQLKVDIETSGMLVRYDKAVVLPQRKGAAAAESSTSEQAGKKMLLWLLPYASADEVEELLAQRDAAALSVEDMTQFNMRYVRERPDERFTIVGCGDVFDNFNDKDRLEVVDQVDEANASSAKCIQLKFNDNHAQIPDELTNGVQSVEGMQNEDVNGEKKQVRFSFDRQPDLNGHPGPSPSIILQALTMSNANDGINLERLETIGDSFLKYAITTYLYITYENVHEGKLSHLRSKQVANLNLYRLGRRKMLGEYMIATKFEPHDNWLPPCYYVPKELEKALIEAKIPPHHWKLVDLPNIKKLSSAEICQLVRDKADKLGLFSDDCNYGQEETALEQPPNVSLDESGDGSGTDFTCFIPYNLVTQHSIPDKSVADCVEALIGAYLIECGSRGALLFMAWLGIRVLPYVRRPHVPTEPRVPGTSRPDAVTDTVMIYGEWKPPKSPLLRYAPNPHRELQAMLEGFDKFEASLGYRFRDRAYLLQAMTHASYSPNRLTDCYQRLEFLGDAVLDYLITRHLYEDPRQHSPGALTDLRSALVNNTIFASLAVRHGFHKYFRHLSPGLNEVIDRFVRIQNENGHCISEEYYLLSEEECDDAEDVEVPKALGDVFESIAGAIFLDSNMSLDVVWQVYSNMMRPEIEQFSNSVPKSPIRELLELEPETAKFGKPEKLADGRRVRVTVDVFCKGTFRGIGRNYRIAKCTAAKCALRQLKKQGLISKKD